MVQYRRKSQPPATEGQCARYAAANGRDAAHDTATRSAAACLTMRVGPSSRRQRRDHATHCGKLLIGFGYAPSLPPSCQRFASHVPESVPNSTPNGNFPHSRRSSKTNPFIAIAARTLMSSHGLPPRFSHTVLVTSNFAAGGPIMKPINETSPRTFAPIGAGIAAAGEQEVHVQAVQRNSGSH